MNRLLVIFCSLVLVGCASSSSRLIYYLLDSGQSAITGSGQSSERKPLVLLEEVTLGELLRQSSLLVQLEDHQMHYALQHVWAEPLGEAIPKTLLKDLRQHSDDFNFEQGSTEWFGKEAYRLRIQIDQFYPNTEQQVLLAGRYWVTTVESGETVAQDFSMTETLTQDGYGHAVVKMRRLIGLLSDSLLKSL
jgi:uncharacterized lipoprotein YmbA